MSCFSEDYVERVYAGVLGKIIGVYLGRPFEGWEHERILAELGEIKGYVNDKVGLPLVITDDDISGTFTFVRALEDYGYSPHLTAAQIGQTWLNYLVENKTILSWAGLGCSTEHTAYLRLKRGIPGAAERVDRDEWAYRGRADRVADLYRRLGHARPGEPATGGRAGGQSGIGKP